MCHGSVGISPSRITYTNGYYPRYLSWRMVDGVDNFLGAWPVSDFRLHFGTSSEVPSVENRRPFDIIVHIHGFFVPIVILVLFWKILTSPRYLLLTTRDNFCRAQFSSSGIVTAHELGHRKPKSFSWWLARLDLLCVNYLHFTVEHNHTHHKHWARPIDPTSAPIGRSVYYHFLRTIPLQIMGAYRADQRM